MFGSHGCPPTAAARRLAAWGVHVLTASGAVWGLLALDAVTRSRPRAALGWMALAVVVDGTDGLLARALRVREALPSVDGSLLDNLVDYLNYVVVPAYLIHHSVPLPGPFSAAAAAAICVASAFQFAHVEAKAGNTFRGFPSYWNIVACYLLLLRPDPRVSLAAVAILCLLVFAPLRFVHPTRTRRLRGLTLTLTIAWAAGLGWLIWRYPHHSVGWTGITLVYGVYYVALGVALRIRRPGRLS